MKTIFRFLIIWSLLFTIFTNCSKDSPTSPTSSNNSNDLQYVGSWSGTTSQSKSISLKVIDSGGKAIVSSITITMRVSGSGWSATETKFSNGSAEIKNGKFDYSASELNVSGTFSSSSSLSGNFSNTSPGPPGYGSGSATGTYTASK